MNAIAPDFYNYKVLYKIKGAPKQIQEDWVSSDLKELMDGLKKQGVSKDTVEFLYVHQSVVGDKGLNGVAEVVCIDNGTAAKTASPEKKAALIVPITRAIKEGKKEKEKTTTEKPKVVAISSGLYSSMQV